MCIHKYIPLYMCVYIYIYILQYVFIYIYIYLHNIDIWIILSIHHPEQFGFMLGFPGTDHPFQWHRNETFNIYSCIDPCINPSICIYVQLHLDMDPHSPIKLVCFHLSLLLLPTVDTLEDWKRKLLWIEPTSFLRSADMYEPSTRQAAMANGGGFCSSSSQSPWIN